VAVDRAILQRYLGKYVIQGDVIEIVPSGDRLKAVYKGQAITMVPISQTRFRLSHWLADVEGIELEFFVGDPNDEDIVVVTMGDHFVCPRYLDVEEDSPLCRELTGKYDVYPRIPSEHGSSKTVGTTEIRIEDGVLRTADGRGLKPRSDTEIAIIGGVFDGETMVRDSLTGNITWQNEAYKPVSPSR